ncbi:GCN5 family acetyltransferase [Actinotalea ferrariae CF5-4]|uniref:GCN5 family acetyltransferase n=1 Tax=Actinotalea ferrariae CF5-4 TaxID=948458 RepID=A0A021VPP5_9CELL|nr:GNAT family N-acetyltransferase [Actinotalea ferrariae]EYR63121.1 GCN5 family acetyltransferase [Actinotalea ferrariae CF5-4]
MTVDGAAPAYPQHWEADVVLRDGGTAHVRPILPADAAALQQFHVGQSERSIYFRFFAPLERLPESDLRRFTQVDHRDRVALVAVAGDALGEHIIAVARYDRVGTRTAEVAFNVADDHHGRGLGSVLLEHLAAAARERGIERFTAEVLPQNAQMIAVFREAGYAVSQRLDDGILTVSFDLDPTERSREVMADREHRAEARSMRGLLDPSSVLVVVAAEPGSARERRLASAVARHLVEAAPAGRRPVVHVVDPAGTGEDVASPPYGVERHATVEDVPGTVDLVVLAVPAATAADVVRRCARLRPRGVVVLSGGFAEVGPEGLAHQRDLLRSAHAAGMRVLGPASFGLLRHDLADDGAVRTVNASLARDLPEPGRLALFCQSAPLAVGLLESASRRRIGLSTFVSSGNRADVSGNDVMQFWTDDPATDVVGLYLESIGNPRKFSRVARRLAATKPVVVLTAGRSGHVIPAGHAVRLTRVPRQALDELLRQSGVIRVDSQHQLLDVAQLLVHQPLPTGRRVAVVAGSDPLAALAAEAVASAGLTVSGRWTTADDDAATLETLLAAVAADRASHDAVVVVHVPTDGPTDPAVPRAVARAAADSGTTTVASVLGLRGITPELTAEDAAGTARTVPAYAAPEDAVVALAGAARYGAWRSADHGRPLRLEGVDPGAARRLVTDRMRDAGPGVVTMDAEGVRDLLACYGIEVWPTVVVRDAGEAVAAADRLGWPVALKSTAGHLRHRIDLGGVRLDLADAPALEAALEQMRTHLASFGETDRPFEVQRMAPPGAACVVRSAEDPRFGPVVSFGLAGDAVDLLGDMSHGIAPLTDTDVREMVRAVRAGPRLFGYRGLPAADVAALEDVLARVSVLADDVPELHHLELHPVVVGERGAAVLGAQVQLSETDRVDSGRRVLPA